MSKKVKTALISLYVFANNGPRFLAASLRNAGKEVIEIYFKDYVYHHFVPPAEKELALLMDVLRKEDVGLVGISCRAGAYLTVAKQITMMVRDQLGVPVMWGGIHVSMAPEDCIDHADFLVMGEAEQAVVDVVETMEQGRDVLAVNNVWASKNGEVTRNALAPLPEGLDHLPFRDFHSHQFKYFIRDGRLHRGDPCINDRMFLVMTSRGCTHNCSFCNVSRIRGLYGKDSVFYRTRSVENLIRELEYIKGTLKKLHRIRFDDQVFISSREWIDEFAQKYKQRIGLPFEILSDPKFYDDEGIIESLKDAGMDKVVVGIQGTGTANKRLYNRASSDEKIIRTGKVLHRHGVMGVFQVIVDDPEVTTEEKYILLDLLLALPRPYILFIFSLCHWPNTRRTNDLIDRGLISIEDVEGHSPKVLRQFLADFSWPRPAEDNFFLALYMLSNKRLVPKSLIRRLSKSDRLRKSPGPLVALAKFMSFAKLVWTGLTMAAKGEIGWDTIRARWVHLLNNPSI